MVSPDVVSQHKHSVPPKNSLSGLNWLTRGSPEGFTTIIGRGGSHRGPRAARHHPHTSHKPFSQLSHPRLLTCCGRRGDTDLPKWVQSSKGAAPTWAMSLLSRQHYQGTTHSGNSLWQEDIRAHPSQQLRQQHPGKQYTPPNFIQEKSTLHGFVSGATEDASKRSSSLLNMAASPLW